MRLLLRKKVPHGLRCNLPLIAVFIISTSSIVAQDVTVEFPRTNSIGDPQQVVEDQQLPGVDLAEGITQLTGVAISPLLGVCTVGTWKYFHTPEASRHLLPWYCNPIFWGIGFAILALCFLKDTVGVGAPPLIKKPLDLIESFEDKFSAAIASAAFVPFVASQMAHNFSSAGPITNTVSAEGYMIAAVPLSAAMTFDPQWILIPISIVGFLLVWIVSHAISILILLSPFGLIDFVLKASRIFLLSSIAVLYWISPILAAIVSVVIIIIAAFLAPSAFRLSVFGTVMGCDFALSLFRRYSPKATIYGFLARQGSKRIKVRSFGRMEVDTSERITFKTRWLLIGPLRSITLPPTERLTLTKGVLFPSISTVNEESGKMQDVIDLLPRYRYATDEVAKALAIPEITSSQMARGFKAVGSWLTEILRSGRDKVLDMQS